MNCTWTPSNTFGFQNFSGFNGFNGYNPGFTGGSNFCPPTSFFGCGPTGCTFPCPTPCNTWNNSWNTGWNTPWCSVPTTNFGFNTTPWNWNNSFFSQPYGNFLGNFSQPWNSQTFTGWTPSFQNSWFQNCSPFGFFNGFQPFGYSTGFQNYSQPFYGFQNCTPGYQPGYFNNTFPSNSFAQTYPYGPYGMNPNGFNASQPCAPTPDMARHNGFGIREAA